jgi:predicted nucleotide-binding protein (sugar kinase/HSP70/actin superfamily)
MATNIHELRIYKSRYLHKFESSNSQKFAKPIITFAHWGNYTFAFETLFKELGIDVILPEITNENAILQGSKLAPEMFCLPMKVNLGNYLSAIKKGANTIFMITASSGSCRLRYYGAVQEKILKEIGKNIDFIIFDQKIKDIYSKIKKISGASFLKTLKSVYYFYRKLNFIERLEKLVLYLRPREIKKGLTDKIFNESILKLKNLKSEREFPKLKKEILKRFSQIEIEKRKKLPKVGLVGEIYTVCDPKINFELEKKLGQEGIEVHREMNLSYHLKKKIFFKDFFIQRKIKNYLGSTVGGHGRDAIYEMLKYIKKGFDGIIQLLPMSCMPEVSVRPILEKIHQETGIPFLSLSFDEQTGEAGINTRIEAFIDLVKNYYKSREYARIL